MVVMQFLLPLILILNPVLAQQISKIQLSLSSWLFHFHHACQLLVTSGLFLFDFPVFTKIYIMVLLSGHAQRRDISDGQQILHLSRVPDCQFCHNWIQCDFSISFLMQLMSRNEDMDKNPDSEWLLVLGGCLPGERFGRMLAFLQLQLQLLKTSYLPCKCNLVSSLFPPEILTVLLIMKCFIPTDIMYIHCTHMTFIMTMCNNGNTHDHCHSSGNGGLFRVPADQRYRDPKTRAAIFRVSRWDLKGKGAKSKRESCLFVVKMAPKIATKI